MTLAGIWRAIDGSIVIEGVAPFYAFRFYALSAIALSEGQIRPNLDGTFQATGMGIGGAVNLVFRLLDANTLQAQAVVDPIAALLYGAAFLASLFYRLEGGARPAAAVSAPPRSAP